MPSVAGTTTIFPFLLFSIFFVVPRRQLGRRLHLFVNANSAQFLFPSNDEYDIRNVFDEDSSIFGAPYGGYSRATRSRLAKLPLRLVGDAQFDNINMDSSLIELRGKDTKEEEEGRGKEENGSDDDDDGDSVGISSSSSSSSSSSTVMMTEDEAKKGDDKIDDTNNENTGGAFFNIRDGQGRLYACRVYREDEVSRRSIKDSMFDEAHEVKIIRKQQQQQQQPRLETQRRHQGSAIPGSEREMSKNIIINKVTEMMNPGVVAGSESEGGTEKESESEIDAGVAADTEDGEVDDADADVDADDDADAGDIKKIFVSKVHVGEGREFIQNTGGHRMEMIDEETMNQMIGSFMGGGGGRPNMKTLRELGLNFDDMYMEQIEISQDRVDNILKKLDGLCAQYHHGYWSYEWCSGRTFKQFHVGSKKDPKKPKNKSGGGNHLFTVESVMNLGQFKSQSHNINVGQTLSGKKKKGDTDLSLSSFVSLKMKQTYSDGDYCEEAGKKRETHVNIRCCTEEEVKNTRKVGMRTYVQRDGTGIGGESAGGVGQSSSGDWVRRHSKMDDVMLLSVTENSDKVCEYEATVCSPLLCGDELLKDAVSSTMADEEDIQEDEYDDDDDDDEEEFDTSDAIQGMSGSSRRKKNRRRRRNGSGGRNRRSRNTMGKNESVRQILQRTFRHACLHRNTGWWRYEFCYGRQVRQFHAETVIDTSTGKATMHIDDEYNLGNFDVTSGYGNGSSDNNKKISKVGKDEEYEDEIEMKHVQNPGSLEAVYIEEYVHGDICQDPDTVVDTAAETNTKETNTKTKTSKNGGKDSSGGFGIERSSTIRYSCGKHLELVNVDEDSSCHYVLNIHVPNLCQHPLFQAPSKKEQVIKCLPIASEFS